MSLIANDPFFNNWGTTGFDNTLGFPYDRTGLSTMGNLTNPLMSSLLPSTTFGGVNPTWRMNMDILDTDKDYIVLVEVPGVPKERVNVNIENNILYIRAEKQQPLVDLPSNFVYIISEVGYGQRRRHVHLPANVNQESVQTCFKDGLLCVKFQKSEAHGPKKLEISDV